MFLFDCPTQLFSSSAEKFICRQLSPSRPCSQARGGSLPQSSLPLTLLLSLLSTNMSSKGKKDLILMERGNGNETGSQKQKRIQWIDALRGLVIFLMVLGHNIQYGGGENWLKESLFFENICFRFIYSFHMPCLMLVSGFFYGHSIKKSNLLSNRIKTVLIPTLIWSLIPIGMVLFSGLRSNQVNGLAWDCLSILFSYYWFMWAILFGSLMIWIVHNYCQDNIFVYSLIGIALLFFPDNVFGIKIYFWFFMYPFFVVGFLWNIRKINEKVRPNNYYFAAVIVLYVAHLFLYDKRCYIYTTGISVRSLEQFSIDILRFLVGFSGSAMAIMLVFYLYRFFEKKMVWINTFFSYLGRISLLFYFIDGLKHCFLPRITKNIPFNYGYVMIETLLCVILYIAIDFMISRSQLARKFLLGGRG